MYTIMNTIVNDRAPAYTVAYVPVEAEKTQRAKEFGERLSACMDALSLSPDSLSPILGCSRGVLYKWKNGETANLDYFLLKELAKALYADMNWLATGSGEEPVYLRRPELISGPHNRRNRRA